MFNLLPNSLKEKIRSEYYIRLYVVIFLAIFIVQISFLIFLSPTWFVSLNKEKEIISQSEKANKASLDLKVDAVNSQINIINNKLGIINSTLEYPRAIPVIDEVLSKKTDNIVIKELLYEVSSEKTGLITLTGNSATRDSLVAFVKDLEESEMLKDVDLPISNLTKEKNLDFSLKISVEIQKNE